MFFLLSKIWAALIIVYGLIILTREKFMVRREYVGIFMLFIMLLTPGIRMFERGNWILFIIVFVIPFSSFLILMNRDRYILFNVNNQIVFSILIDILKEKNITFEREKNSIILKNYDNRRIEYSQSLNSVEVNFRGVRKLIISEEIKEELRSRIRKIKVKVFPLAGLFLITIGSIIMVTLLYLSRGQ